jgi:(p)ppGpp synthase/HD superfamily hydrolase
MGKIKQSLKNEDKEYDLQQLEREYLLMLQALGQNIQKVTEQLSGMYLSFVAQRLGYNKGENLMFDIDLDDPKSKLKVRVIDNHPKQERP